MAVARREKTQPALKQSGGSKAVPSKAAKKLASEILDGPTNKSGTSVAEAHLPPLLLILAILACSGAVFVLAMRDFWTTGRNIAGPWDRAMLEFTKSTSWFDDSKAWKSTQGGFSAIRKTTTDDNNMGGFFVRKVAGAAAMAVHLHKLLPMLVHPTNAQWTMGHFRPLLWTSVFANVAVAAFYGSYMDELQAHRADALPKLIMGLMAVETLAILLYLFTSRKFQRGPAVVMKEGKTPSSVTSRIVTRTVLIVSVVITVVAGRDLLAPGTILPFVPRDDIYLEWTGSLLHSPPDGTPESIDHGLEAPLHVGDRFVSQFLALHVLVLCLYKYVSALVRYGSDGRGEVQCKMMWRVSAIGNALVLFVFRLFTPAAASASLDLRWHLMLLGYETFILGLYGFL